jgi:ubiquinone/menaquinone biosynthesis C-methylase UbiE
MGSVNLWSFGGGPGSLSYATFDFLRNRLNRRLSSFLHRRVQQTGNSPATILEAGSGPGFCSSLLSRSEGVRSSVILDIDPEVLRIASQRPGRLSTVQGDIFNVPFPDNSFDLVFNSSTLEHLDRFDAAFREMVRVTKRGGYIFVGVPYRYGPFVPFVLFPKKHAVSIWMGRLFSRRSLLEACRAEGLTVEDVVFYFFRCFVGVLLIKKKEQAENPAAMRAYEAV